VGCRLLSGITAAVESEAEVASCSALADHVSGLLLRTMQVLYAGSPLC
jgi:hypothetical protein